jgi:hypothetical protein
MTLQSLRHAVWPALVACAALAACSKTPATQDAYVNAFINSTGPGPCNLPFTQVLLIGTTGLTAPTSIPSGEDSSEIQCSVVADGADFDLALSATVGQQQFVVNGKVDSKTGGSVAVTFVNQNAGVFSQQDCTLDYTYAGGPLPPGSTNVAPGEIFGHVDCPMAVYPQQQLGTEDGGVADESCEGTADFSFANCSQ